MKIYSIFRKFTSLEGSHLHWVVFTPDKNKNPELIYDQLVSCEEEATLILTRLEGSNWKSSSLYTPIKDKHVEVIHLGTFNNYPEYAKEIDNICGK